MVDGKDDDKKLQFIYVTELGEVPTERIMIAAANSRLKVIKYSDINPPTPAPTPTPTPTPNSTVV
jgi:hypothetical protein